MQAAEVLQKYITFFEKREHIRIPNSSLVPDNDPTTLFTSSGMQPLVPYLLGEEHPSGKKLVNVQNCFRAQDIDEIGDNRHTTFFRMLGNWSLGDYFKKEQIPWFFEFLTNKEEGLGLDPNRLYVSVFEGYQNIPRDEESAAIWKDLFEKSGVSAEGRIFFCGVEDNWWSRAGVPDNMPPGEPGGPDTEVYFDLDPSKGEVKGSFKELSDSGRLLEIGNSVFMQFIKTGSGFGDLPQKNVDFGGGLERLVVASEDQRDLFKTSLLDPIIKSIEDATGKKYEENQKQMRIVTDHFTAAVFITANGLFPSNKEQGYILRRLIRRGFDNLHELGSENVEPIIGQIVEQYKTTDPYLEEKFETIKNVILEESQKYARARSEAKNTIERELRKQGVERGDELKGMTEISADLAFKSLASYGLGPTQLRSLGYSFNEQELAEKIKEHQDISRKGAEKKFAGGLADHSEKTVHGHTATHLLQQALRDVFGESLHQAGSNITSERLRFDFNLEQKPTEDELQKVEDIVNGKIQENLPVHFEMMTVDEAKQTGAIGLFDEKYEEKVKVYFIGEYSKEFCGGPHVDFTGTLKRFKIIKEESLGRGQRRIYAVVD